MDLPYELTQKVVMNMRVDEFLKFSRALYIRDVVNNVSKHIVKKSGVDYREPEHFIYNGKDIEDYYKAPHVNYFKLVELLTDYYKLYGIKVRDLDEYYSSHLCLGCEKFLGSEPSITCDNCETEQHIGCVIEGCILCECPLFDEDEVEGQFDQR